MTPKLIKTENGQYEAAPWSGSNTSGIAPLGENILIRTDTASTSKGGILFTNDSQEKQNAVAITGTIYALGDDAFLWNSTRTKPFAGRRPQPGDRVLFQQYAGVLQTGLDGVLYRLMPESVIGGLLLQE
jgi:chaperonin GroES